MNEDTIKEQLAVLLYEVKETRIQATKTNGRLTTLENSQREDLINRIEIKKDLEAHEKEDSVAFSVFASTQKEHSKGFVEVKRLIWMLAGGGMVVSSLLPHILNKVW